MAHTPSPADLAGRPLYLLSFNVAGFKTCLGKMDQFVPGGFTGWMERHQADIVCLQEVKIGRKDVAAEPRKCGARAEGFDSFWAFNDGSGGQRLGLNGVTTFVRKGLTCRANAAPLGDPALDGEGRCLLTDHGPFVVFNVYVPNAGGGSRLPYKQRWLRALVAAMG
jgi:exonuclease III